MALNKKEARRMRAINRLLENAKSKVQRVQFLTKDLEVMQKHLSPEEIAREKNHIQHLIDSATNERYEADRLSLRMYRT